MALQFEPGEVFLLVQNGCAVVARYVAGPCWDGLGGVSWVDATNADALADVAAAVLLARGVQLDRYGHYPCLPELAGLAVFESL